jgi:hypothetical protein
MLLRCFGSPQAGCSGFVPFLATVTDSRGIPAYPAATDLLHFVTVME